MDVGSGDTEPQTFEESVSSWSDALSFAPASRLLDSSSSSNPWSLGEKDSSHALTQTLAMHWDDELLRATGEALSSPPSSSSASSSVSFDAHPSSLDDSPDHPPIGSRLGSESPYTRKSRSLSSGPTLPAFSASKARVVSLWRVMWQFLGRDFGLAGMLLLLHHFCLLLPLLLLPPLMTHLQFGSSQVSEVRAFVLSALVCAALLLFAFFRSQASFLSGRLSLHFVSALRGLVFSKSLRLKFKPWDSRLTPLFTYVNVPQHVQDAKEASSAQAFFILLSLPTLERYLLRFHELWTTPLLAIACCLQLLRYAHLAAAFAGLFIFAAFLTLSQFLTLRAAEEEQHHAIRTQNRDAQLKQLLTQFKRAKEDATDEFFEGHLKAASPSPALYVWSLSFCSAIITPILASIAAVFTKTTIAGTQMTVQEFVLINAIFYLLHYFVQPYYELLRHSLKMRDIMDLTRLLLLEEETESFEHSNTILNCARYAVLTQYHKLDLPVPQKPENPQPTSTEMDEDRFGGFFEPPADTSDAPISMPLARSPSSSNGMTPSSSNSSLAASIASPKKNPRPFAPPSADVIRIPAKHHIQLTNASFEWDSSGQTRRLKRLNLSIRRGQLVVVLGSADSGKSSLFKALLGEMTLKSGTVNIEGSMSYAPQVPWTLNETLCFNITFDHDPSNKDRYNHVLSTTGLKDDIDKLEGGDRTLLSDANFTPAQLARISLARCLYRLVDIYLIDDIFATFESMEAANKVLERAIASTPGTRVLALSKYMPIIERADLIVHLSEGEVAHAGTYQELLAEEPDFFEALEISTKATQFMSRKPLFHQPPEATSHSPVVAIDPTEVLAETLGFDSVHIAGPSFDNNGVKFKTGLRYYFRRIKMSTTWVVLFTLLAMVAVELTRYISSAFWFQEHNPSFPLPTTPIAPNQIRINQFPTVVVYTLLSGSCAGLFVSAFWFFSRGAMDASNKIWFALVDVVLRWPLSVLQNQDGAHVARMLSFEAHRFQSLLPRHMHYILNEFVMYLCFLLVSVAAVPISALTTLGTLGVAARLHGSFHAPLCRLGHRCVKSSMLLESCYESVLQGAVTVRAHKAEQRFTNAFYARQDEANAAKLSTLLLTQHLNLRLGLWASLLPSGLCVCATILALMGFKSAALFGIAFFFAFRACESLPHLLHDASQLVTLIQALFNVRTIISHSPSEDAWYDAKLDPRSVWPSQGSIVFSHITLRNKHFETKHKKVEVERDPELDMEEDVEDEERISKEKCSLWDVSLTVPGGSSVAICGREGCGKSAIVRALMRFDNPERHGVSVVSVGNVKLEIDGLDVRKMGLHTLRKSISIISPQIQTMTIREYLSANSEFDIGSNGDSMVGIEARNASGEDSMDETTIWDALEKVGLKDKISFSPVKLETVLHQCAADSASTSHQHHQQDFTTTELLLLSMARAICRKTRIILFKESRSRNDYDAQLVSNTLFSIFAAEAEVSLVSSTSPKPVTLRKKHTLVVLANSSDFVRKANKVFVMEQGEVVQEGTPKELSLQPPDTTFNRLFRAIRGEHALETFDMHSELTHSSSSAPLVAESSLPAPAHSTTIANLIDL